MTSIAQERLRRMNIGLVMRTREQWGAVFDYTWSVDPPRNYRPVDEPASRLFWHITITDPDSYSSNDHHARAVERIGISRFPNTGISYNGLVLPGGHLYEGQPFGRRGAHTVNDFNRGSCTTSGCPGRGSSLLAPSWNLNVNARALALARNTDDPVTDADVDAAARWGAGYKLAGMVASSARWHGHRCVSAKSCPGDKAWTRIDDVADLTATYLRNGLPQPEDDDMTPEQDTLLKYISLQVKNTAQLIIDTNEVNLDKHRASALRIESLFKQVLTEQGLTDDKIDEILAEVNEQFPDPEPVPVPPVEPPTP
jgi:N-acetylmuramoyl-L-alanine amidase